VIAETAFTLHVPLSELLDMDADELLEWHREAAKINAKLKG
jgi:hypothetical protein